MSGSSETTRAAVTRYLEMVGAGADAEQIASLFSEDVDWEIFGDADHVPWIGRVDGRAGVAAFFRQLRDRLEPVRFHLRAVLADGENAAVLGSFASRVRATGKLFESEFVLEFTVTNGRITRYRLHEDSFALSRAFQP